MAKTGFNFFDIWISVKIGNVKGDNSSSARATSFICYVGSNAYIGCTNMKQYLPSHSEIVLLSGDFDTEFGKHSLA